MQIELHSRMSRAEFFRVLEIVRAAAARLAPRMTDAEIARLFDGAAALAEIGATETARRDGAPRRAASSRRDLIEARQTGARAP